MTDDKDGQWHPYFAVLPVTVDAYEVSEMRGDGRMRWTVWMKNVERRWDEELPEPNWRYRLPRVQP